MKTIVLSILRSVIMEAVKSETFIKGLADKSADERASLLAYQESAGDEDFHERKLNKTMTEAADTLSTYLGDYLSTETNQKTGDNAIVIDHSDAARITIKIKVSDRFNESYTDSLARLSSKFIETRMLVLWWNPINPNQAKIYENNEANVLLDIKRCFNKIAPRAPICPFTSSLSLETNHVDIVVPKGETTPFKCGKFTSELKYTIDDDVIDDIEYEEYRRNRCSHIEKLDGSFRITALNIGSGTVFVWSRHREADTMTSFKITVRYEEE